MWKEESEKVTLYAVIVKGVYRHEITGVYDTWEKAKARAEECIQAERDTYHDFIVGAIELNTAAEDVVEVGRVSKRYVLASKGKATYLEWAQ